MSATKTLAQFIVDTGYDALPTSVVEAAKIAILDGVANMLGHPGGHEPAPHRLREIRRPVRR